MRAYECRCWRCTKRNSHSRKWPLSSISVTSRNVPPFASSTRQRAQCTQDGNRIFSLPYPQLESSSCPALTSSCSCQMRLTCFERYEHLRQRLNSCVNLG